MSEECTHDCSTCQSACASKQQPESMIEELNEVSSVKKVIGVVSGKGGVGKSLVTSLLACAMNKKGFHTAVLDADVTGPSIPKMFGIHSPATADHYGLYPVTSEGGIEVMSLNLLLPEETDPVVWRGPVIAGTVKQFWTDVVWKDVDYMFVDMPPGTGDVPLTVFQSLPVDGIVVVTSPQELVSMIVAKAAKMAQLMDIPLLGLVENMSYYVCPDCGGKHAIFGEGHSDKLAEKYGFPTVCRLPMDSNIALACDKGEIERVEGDWLAPLTEALEGLVKEA